jgi:hypothetical protein
MASRCPGKMATCPPMMASRKPNENEKTNESKQGGSPERIGENERI